MKPKEFTAQMSRSLDGSHWRIYVVVLGSTEWPSIPMREPKGVIPTVTARAAALEELGFRTQSELPEWEWEELDSLGDLDVPVELFATTTVIPLDIGYPARSGTPPHS